MHRLPPHPPPAGPATRPPCSPSSTPRPRSSWPAAGSSACPATPRRPRPTSASPGTSPPPSSAMPPSVSRARSSRSRWCSAWGRRIPAAVLAAGACAALLGGLAGLVVVTASVTGLREDHGQWSIDSLVLVAAPLAAWFVLTAAAVRATRAEGLPRWLRALIRPGRGAALAAGIACAAYGALKLDWALGGELLLRETPLPAGARRAARARADGGRGALGLGRPRRDRQSRSQPPPCTPGASRDCSSSACRRCSAG